MVQRTGRADVRFMLRYGVSRMAGGGLDIGAASLPIHYTTSPSALSLGAAG